MKNLKFSVSMCVYGGDNPHHFDQALESIFSQTRLADELVLVVDGPIPDETDRIIKKHQALHNNLFKVFRLEKNCGHGVARSTGLERCKYDYVAIADADDINAPNRFEVQMEYFERQPELAAVSSSCFHFYESVFNVINEEKMPQSDAEIKKAMKTSCPICQPSVILNRKEVLKAGGYQDWYMAEDYYLWIRMMLNGAEFANTPMSLLYLRTTPEQMARRGGYKYFNSMRKLYQYMYAHKVIGLGTLIFNVSTRFVVQVLMPGKLRAVIRRLVQ